MPPLLRTPSLSHLPPHSRTPPASPSIWTRVALHSGTGRARIRCHTRTCRHYDTRAASNTRGRRPRRTRARHRSRARRRSCTWTILLSPPHLRTVVHHFEEDADVIFALLYLNFVQVRTYAQRDRKRM
ncbi:hypothetical protein B0H13DRAFT_2305489 [Mycena leptocephala]|nr:hypothetical protein B0H13DRAFT_2305489 [Mycena leptocephala]